MDSEKKIDEIKHPFLFSVGSRIAYHVDIDFYGMHYLWIAYDFHNRDKQAASSDPYTIARYFIDGVVTLDRHSDQLNRNVAGILNGANKMLEAKVINEKQHELIIQRIKGALRSDFLPVAYVIDTRKVNARIEEVPPSETAREGMPEYRIYDLVTGEFQMVDLSSLLEAAHMFPRRFFDYDET